MPKQKRLDLVTKLMNECTGVMKVDDEDNYAGYYTRHELMDKLLKEGHDRQAVDVYIFCGLKGCTEWHPSVEEFNAMILEETKGEVNV